MHELVRDGFTIPVGPANEREGSSKPPFMSTVTENLVEVISHPLNHQAPSSGAADPPAELRRADRTPVS